jgi:hypothetical protein
MKFELLNYGFVSQRTANTPTAVAAGSRCALTVEGDLVCTFMVQSALGINDFVPLLARSKDKGETWVDEGPLWPELRNKFALFGSVSRSPGGELFFFGTRTPIDRPGESFWSDATRGMKQCELFWAKSVDGGRGWTCPTVIPMPIPGTAEAPGPMSITHDGRWLVCYAPYNNFDPDVVVDRNQVVLLYSDNQGKTWEHTSMFRFSEVHSGAAEAWVIELTDGRLLGTCWHMDHRETHDYPNPYALSSDRGDTWQPSLSTGIEGQSTALAALSDARAFFAYSQRKRGELGIWLSVVNPSESQFIVECNQIVWRAEATTQTGSPPEHSQWQDFSFGEPSVTLLEDNTVFITLWCVQPSGRGIRYVRLRIEK